jgi:hypothetical protein
VRLELLDELDGLLAGLGDPDDLEALVLAQAGHEQLAEEPMVIDDQNADSCRRPRLHSHSVAWRIQLHTP